MINDITLQWIKMYINRPQASLIIENNEDYITANNIINEIYEKTIGDNHNKLQIYNYEDKNSIGIEEVKDIIKSIKLKADATNSISRFLVIKESEKLTPEAQNVLLKTIEELPKSTVIVLSVTHKDLLLNTIQSRCFTIPILPISRKEIRKYAKDNNIEESIAETAYLLSEGNAGKFIEYIDNENLIVTESINKAKKFIINNVFERQNIINSLKNSDESIEFIAALKLVAASGMRNAKDIKSKNKWKNIVKQTIKTQEYIKSNTNSKLSLLKLSVDIT